MILMRVFKIIRSISPTKYENRIKVPIQGMRHLCVLDYG